jgi:hypothetical protein
VTKQLVNVMFSCMHEGQVEISRELDKPMSEVNPSTEVNVEIIQYVVFRKKILCPVCDGEYSITVWEK